MPRQQSQSRPTSLQVKPKTNTVIHPPSIITAAPSSFGQVMKDGIGFGAGSAIGQRVVAAMFGPQTISVAPAPSERKELCLSERDTFEACMRSQTVCNNEFMAYSHCIKLQKGE
jgi:hypothetical protein